MDTPLQHILRRAVRYGIRKLRGTSARSQKPAVAPPPPPPAYSPPAHALDWLRRLEHPDGGFRAWPESGMPNASATGILIPILLDYGEQASACRSLNWLIAAQNAEGGYDDQNGRPSLLHTGQALRGLMAGRAMMPESIRAACRTADYLAAVLSEATRRASGMEYPEQRIPLPVIAAMFEAGDLLQKDAYRQAAEQLPASLAQPVESGRLRIPGLETVCELEALIDMGQSGLALPVLDLLRRFQREDGALPIKRNHAALLAQASVAWYKAGDWEPADKAMAWLETHQQSAGSFPECDADDDGDLRAVMAYLKANRLRVVAWFDRFQEIISDTIAPEDGRVQILLSLMRPKDRVLDIGCGKGRYLRAIREVYHESECVGVDISPALLSYAPEGVETRTGSLEAIPYPDNSFDVTFSIEAIEHSPNPQAAIREMIRVTRPGGYILVIDKPRSQWGRLECLPWELWPQAGEIESLLSAACEDIGSRPVSYNRQAADGLMMAWQGRKRVP